MAFMRLVAGGPGRRVVDRLVEVTAGLGVLALQIQQMPIASCASNERGSMPMA